MGEEVDVSVETGIKFQADKRRKTMRCGRKEKEGKRPKGRFFSMLMYDKSSIFRFLFAYMQKKHYLCRLKCVCAYGSICKKQ